MGHVFMILHAHNDAISNERSGVGHRQSLTDPMLMVSASDQVLIQIIFRLI